jgi:hypothetical protein
VREARRAARLDASGEDRGEWNDERPPAAQDQCAEQPHWHEEQHVGGELDAAEGDELREPVGMCSKEPRAEPSLRVGRGRAGREGDIMPTTIP